MLKLLLIVPHPDDEVYGASGTLMTYLEAGHPCGLITLTRGEAGRSLGLVDSPEALAELRAVELQACLDVIGLRGHPQSVFEHHEFPDGRLQALPLEALIQVAQEALQRLKPQILLTFPPNGSNGHPDHITTHRAVKGAWDSLPTTERPRLWCYTTPHPPEREDLQAQWLPPNIFQDISTYTVRKIKAIACHRSQALSTVDFLRRFPERLLQESFHELSHD